MKTKSVARHQQVELVQRASDIAPKIPRPPKGWLATVRSALGLSATQLARRAGVTRAYISNAEKAELTDSLTLKRLQRIAEAMECKLVYFVIPNKDIEKMLEEQALKKATALVLGASKHMALEGQMLDKEALDRQITRLANELLVTMPSDFWDEEGR